MSSVLPPPEEKAVAVRRMFDSIAPRYDRLNRVMTGRMDQRWRRELVRRARVRPGDVVLDLACGTGDFSLLVEGRAGRIVGLDFAREMLVLARRRTPAAGLVQGDALRMPLAPASVDVALSGFALRNFSAIAPVLAELARVMRPGGRLGLLEVDTPRNGLVRRGHQLYFNRVVPLVGGWLSDRRAYAYLPASASYLPPEEELLPMIGEAGFERVRKRSHMLGAIQAITAVRR
jgi:demethylmenaquinone methyltransferase/2-methoxy-6-polyprenyl-1,4-benzoquinol methylase